MSRVLLVVVLTILTASCAAVGDRVEPRRLRDPEIAVYKTVDDVYLSIVIYKPSDWDASDTRPAVVFFSGGWHSSNLSQFTMHCKYFASRGIVAMAAEFRVSDDHNTLAKHCVMDAKSAIRWVRKNADDLGVDPDRIAAAGSSASGHVAACTGTIVGYEEPGEDTAVSSIPSAMVLFNPIAALAPIDGRTGVMPPKLSRQLEHRMGTDPINLSPAHHVKPRTPPTIMFYGSEDDLIIGGKGFNATMIAAGNRCELNIYDGYDHGFFNFDEHDNEPYMITVEAMDRFLASLDWLEGEPTVRDK